MSKVQSTYWISEEAKMIYEDLGINISQFLETTAHNIKAGLHPELLLNKKQDLLLQLASIDNTIELAKERSEMVDVATVNRERSRGKLRDMYNRFNRGGMGEDANVVWLNSKARRSLWRAGGFSDVYECVNWLENGGR